MTFSFRFLGFCIFLTNVRANPRRLLTAKGLHERHSEDEWQDRQETTKKSRNTNIGAASKQHNIWGKQLFSGPRVMSFDLRLFVCFAYFPLFCFCFFCSFCSFCSFDCIVFLFCPRAHPRITRASTTRACTKVPQGLGYLCGVPSPYLASPLKAACRQPMAVGYLLLSCWPAVGRFVSSCLFRSRTSC